MELWCCGELALAAAVLLTSKYLYGRNARPLPLIAAAAVSSAVFWLVFCLLAPHGGAAALCAMAAGEAAYLAAEALRAAGFADGGEKRRALRALIPMAALFLGADATFAPFVRYDGEDFWNTFVIGPVAVFLVALVLTGDRGEKYMDVGGEGESVRADWPLIVSPAASIVAAFAVSAVADDMSGAVAALWFVILGTLYCGILFLISLAKRQRELQSLLEEAVKWQKESQDYIKVIRSQRHDLNIHLHAISGLISGGHYDECRRYVEELVKNAADINDIMPVRDAVVGSMLYNMREKARSQGSDIYYNVKYDLSGLLINGFECNKIIGNLLQNAIDALDSEEAKRFGIRLDIFKRRGSAVIIAENYFRGNAEKVAAAFEAGYSTKEGHEGIGLAMVQKTLARCNGRIYPEFGENTVRFIVSIPVRFAGVEEKAAAGDSGSKAAPKNSVAAQRSSKAAPRNGVAAQRNSKAAPGSDKPAPESDKAAQGKGEAQ